MDSGFLQHRSSSYRVFRLWAYTEDGVHIRLFHEPHENCDPLEFSFWEMTEGVWSAIESEAVRYEKDEHGVPSYQTDTPLMKTLYLRYMLRGWNLDCPVRLAPEGWLSDETFNALMRLHPAILRQLCDHIYDYTISEEEEQAIAPQCSLLFDAGKSVPNPHPMVSLYCELTAAWEKLGLNYFDLQRLPLRTKNALRKMMSLETTFRNARMERETAQMKSAQNRR